MRRLRGKSFIDTGTVPPNGRDRRSIWRVGTESTWTTILPVAFIIVSLLSLVILPIVVSSHTRRMREQITRIAEPARADANEIQIDLSSELDKIIAFQVTGQPQYRVEYERLIAEQKNRYRQLQDLAPQLDETVGQDLVQLLDQMNRWHQGVATGEFLMRQQPEQVFQTRIFERHPAYEAALHASSRLELDIQRAVDDRLGAIRSAERINISLTSVLTLLALSSALMVAALGRQMRLLAREAVRRRREAETEAADAKAARAAAEKEERRAAFLASASQELTVSLDYTVTVATLARLIVPNLAEACAIDMLEGEKELRREAVAHRDANIAARMSEGTGKTISDVPELFSWVIRDRQAKMAGSSAVVSRYLFGDVPQGEATSIMAIPLVSRGQTLGIITAAASQGRTLEREDALLVTELARHAALAIDNSRLYLDSQQALRARDEVMAIVSHDLRNPLNSVMLAASLLETVEGLDADSTEQLEIIGLSAQRMNRLIADLMDVTRLEGGKRLPIDPEALDLGSLLHEANEMFKAQASAAMITLRIADAESLPPVYADRHRIMQVVSNLLGNALKFTPRDGVITISTALRDQDVLVRVSDTGPGIPKENLQDIFNPYWQAKRTERLGAGLGLPIAKGIVESHGGTIWVESRPNDGTTFFFTLPLHRVEEGAEQKSAN